MKLVVGTPPPPTDEVAVRVQDDGAGGIDLLIGETVVATVMQDGDGIYLEAIECGGCDDAIQMDGEKPEYIWVNF